MNYGRNEYEQYKPDYRDDYKSGPHTVAPQTPVNFQPVDQKSKSFSNYVREEERNKRAWEMIMALVNQGYSLDNTANEVFDLLETFYKRLDATE